MEIIRVFYKKSGLPLVEGGNQQKTNYIISIASYLTSKKKVMLAGTTILLVQACLMTIKCLNCNFGYHYLE